MNYASVSDLSLRLAERFVALYPVATEAEADLSAAEAEIDGMIGLRYQTPAPPSALLRTWTVTLAEELAWSRSGKSKTPENVEKRAAAVRLLLIRVSDGKMRLDAVEAAGSPAAAAVTVESDPPVFNRTGMEGF